LPPNPPNQKFVSSGSLSELSD